MAASNTTFRAFTDKSGNELPNTFVGFKGEVFWDPDFPVLYMSDGVRPGGVPITSGVTAATIAALVNFTPSGNLVASDVQSGLEELDLDKLNKAGDTMTGFLTLHADPTANMHPVTKQYADNLITNLSINDLIDANTLSQSTGDILQYNGTEWVSTPFVPTVDTYVSSAAFSAGQLRLFRNDGNTVTVNLDGRYARSVNGIVPGVNGNIVLGLVATKTGPIASRLPVDTDGTIYIVSGDPNPALDGTTYIYSTAGNQWYQIASWDTAANDARFVNISGDTMGGDLTLAWDPTAPLHAATKQYVDAAANNQFWTNYPVAIANTPLKDLSDVSVTSAVSGNYLKYNGVNWVAANVVTVDTFVTNTAFTKATGDFTITMNDGTTYTTNHKISINDLSDVSTAGVANGQFLAWNGLNWAFANTTLVTVNAVSFDSSNGHLKIVSTDTSNVATNLDGRYALLAGDTMTGFLTLSANPTANLHAATKEYVDTSIAAIPEYFTSNATFNSNTLVLTQTRNDSTTYTTTLSHKLSSHSDVSVSGAAAGQYLTYNGSLWVATTPVQEIYLQSATFTANSGVLTLYKNDSTTATVSLDGRYARKVNNVSPDVNGNIILPLQSAAGTNNEIQFNTNGAFGSNANFTYNQSNSTLTVSNVITTAATLKTVTANGSIGTAGQVLTSNGSQTYWSTIAGVNTAAQYAWTNTHSFSNTVTLNAVSANGSIGTAGQVLTSNGTVTYWSNVVTTDTFVSNATFSNTGVLTLTLNNSNTVTANLVHSIDLLTDVDTTTTTPANNDILSWDGTNWIPKAITSSSVTVSNTAPTSPAIGDLWYDSEYLEMFVYYNDGVTGAWVNVSTGGGSGKGKATVSDSPPAIPSNGDLWYDSASLEMYVYYEGTTPSWINISNGNRFPLEPAMYTGTTDVLVTGVSESPYTGTGWVKLPFQTTSPNFSPISTITHNTTTGNFTYSGTSSIKLEVIVQATFSFTTGGNRAIWVGKTGDTVRHGIHVSSNYTGWGPSISTSVILHLQPNDTFYVAAWSNGTTNVLGSTNLPQHPRAIQMRIVG